ncbi:HDOD domain-containing protein [Nitrincola sp. MINF-07-Sa-05]|uniref:HDOD domain-containing protein n=1 Tax=Nitrincola salilacus TaxID=3400273 RepID=UPI003918141E
MNRAERLRGTDAWVRFLADKPLPARSSSVLRLQKILGESENEVSVQQLARLVAQDPVICLHVARQAQAMHKEAAQNTRVTGIDHAVQTLGLDQLNPLLDSLQTLRLNPRNPIQKMYFRSIANSMHASVQVSDWLSNRKAPFNEEARLAAMLYGFTHWLLWLHAPLHQRLLFQKTDREEIDSALAEQDVYGCTLQSIGRRIAILWGLPELVVKALDHGTSPTAQMLQKLHQRAMKDPQLDTEKHREISHFVQQPLFPVKLCNWLSLTVTLGWNSSKAARLIDIVSDLLRLEADDTRARLHGNCAEAARQYHVPGTLSPAAELLMCETLIGNTDLLDIRQWQNFLEQYPTPQMPESILSDSPTPSAVIVSGPSTTPGSTTGIPTGKDTLNNPQLVERLIQRFREPEPGRKPGSILRDLMHGLNQGIGLKRIALLRTHIGQQQLRTVQVIGFEAEHPILRFEYDLSVPSLFKRLCKEPACISINQRTRNRSLTTLPDSFRALLAGDDCLLISIFMAGKPIAIVYADQGERAAAMSDFYYDHFRKLCAAATVALKSVAAP